MLAHNTALKILHQNQFQFQVQDIKTDHQSLNIQSLHPLVQETSDQKIARLKKELEIQKDEERKKEAEKIAKEEEEKFEKYLEDLQKKRKIEDEYIKNKKKELENPFSSDKGFIQALEDDIEIEYENGIDYAKNTYNSANENVNYYSEKAKLGWQYLMALKWIVNFWLVGVPYVLYCIFAIVWNLYWNIVENKWWAHGNVILLGSSIYLVIQAIFSMLMMFEMAFIIRWIKPFRLLSLVSALLYNFFYILFTCDWFYQVFYSDKTQYDNDHGIVDIFFNMFIIYNIIINAPIVPMNTLIFLKELQLQVFQLIGDPNSPDPADRLQIGLVDLEDSFWTYLNLINPFWWLYNWYKFLLHYDPWDIVIENPNNEENYYKNSNMFKKNIFNW